MKIKRRVGPDPHTLPEIIAMGGTPALNNCPDVFELEDGDYAVIGIRITQEARPLLPADAGCGPDEEVVRVPKSILESAARHMDL